jgi:hypothetical protein
VRVRGNLPGIAGFTVLVVVLLAARSATTQMPDSFAERCRLRVVSWLDPSRRTEIRDRLYTVVAYSAKENRHLNEWIERTTTSDDRIYIWGFVPETYIVTGRINPTRFVYNLPQRAPWTKAAAREELMKELHEQPPKIIVVEQGDVMPHVTGTTLDSAAELDTFAALHGLVDREYRLAYHTTRFDAYMAVSRQPLSNSTQGPAKAAGSAGMGVKLKGRSQGE